MGSKRESEIAETNMLPVLRQGAGVGVDRRKERASIETFESLSLDGLSTFDLCPLT